MKKNNTSERGWIKKKRKGKKDVQKVSIQVYVRMKHNKKKKHLYLRKDIKPKKEKREREAGES